MKKSFIALFLVMFLLMSGCAEKKEGPDSGPFKVSGNSHQHVIVETPKDNLRALGIELGDSVNVMFSNGKTLNDIPVYDGFYGSYGDPMLINYPPYDNPIITRNYLGLFSSLDLKDGDTVSISVNQKGKYLKEQNCLSLVLSDRREDYSSDIEFANFRQASMGSLKKWHLYRSASPCDNTFQRVKTVNKLCEESGINYVIDVGNDEDALKKLFDENADGSAYWRKLYQEGAVFSCKLPVDYRSETFTAQMRKIIAFLDSHREDSILIHCLEGRDRTGVAMMILEALGGASVDEIIADYMTTYTNGYHFTKDSDPQKYDCIKKVFALDIIEYLAGKPNPSDEELKNGVEKLLAEK